MTTIGNPLNEHRLFIEKDLEVFLKKIEASAKKHRAK